VYLDLATVTDLLDELEACQPDAEVRIAQQPAWPFEYAIDPGSVVYLGQGAQLSYLSEPVREQLGS
jgi:hypothetical protein